MKKYSGYLMFISVMLIVIGFSTYGKRPKTAAQISQQLKAQCDQLASQQGYKCSTVVVVLK
jgi:hypothetical protein